MNASTLSALAARAERILGITITVRAKRASHYAGETGEAYWLTRDDLRYAAACAEEHPHDAYSHWCAGTGRQMTAVSRRRIYGSGTLSR